MSEQTNSIPLDRRRGMLLAGICVLFVGWPAWDWWDALPEGLEAKYVGRDSCLKCHQQEVDRWKGSDHDLAMDLATPEFVLGDFDQTELEHHGITSRMSRRGDQFFVETEGPDGKHAEFPVKYVFGVRPLQQYLAEFDGGRVQVLPVTWDTEEKRWFYANPDAPFGPDDPLHWTGSAQNWNHMCADCHSTSFEKNYDLKSNTHHYAFSEMDVSCEACHGPGSLHLELAESSSLFWDRRYGYGLANLKEQTSQTELETCAPCHSRRRRLSPGFKPGDSYSDHYALSLLDEQLYHPDGQIDDEVYVYGSFLQSKMYRKGVRCTDCHDPHTTQLKFDDNRLCTQCHIPGKYDTAIHHNHKSDSKGSLCVECHMPSKNYMVVDPRRDHSLRIPRPDLTVSLGVPNACNECHTKPEETAGWAAAKVVEWYGPKRRDDPHYGEIIAAGRDGHADALEELAKLRRSPNVSPIVHATAVSLLATRYPVADTKSEIRLALKSSSELVRAAAIQAFGNWPLQSQEDAEELHELLVPLFDDTSRLVRTEAGRVSLEIPPAVFMRTGASAQKDAIDEYRRAVLMNADQGGAHLSLGLLYSAQGDNESAKVSYRTAIKLDPAVAGPRSNLAQLLESEGDAQQARELRLKEADLLDRDARLVPDHGMLQYRLGLLQYTLGREPEAEAALTQAVQLEPDSVDFRMALTLFYEKFQRWSKARQSAEALVSLDPDNPTFGQILQNIRAASARSVGPSVPGTP